MWLYVKLSRQEGRKDLWNLFVWVLIEWKGWAFLRLRIVSLSRRSGHIGRYLDHIGPY